MNLYLDNLHTLMMLKTVFKNSKLEMENWFLKNEKYFIDKFVFS